MSGLDAVRTRAFGRSLMDSGSLESACERLGFVQADPIRAPARAQDLILRQRVADYRIGDLERHYPDLSLDEGLLYAWGFVRAEDEPLLHELPTELTELDRQVLAAVADGEAHPKQLAQRVGGGTLRNAWGGQSRATKLSVDRLQRAGLLRVTHRVRGVRCYGPARTRDSAVIAPRERFRRLVHLVAHVLGPVNRRTLISLVAGFRRRIPAISDHRAVVDRLVADGELVATAADGEVYLEPPGAAWGVDRARVRMLAPFDPVVWDRRRFEHLFGWAYRFEAYTPAAKRVRGYYALPLAFGVSVVGWCNVSRGADGVDFDVGFVAGRPNDTAFDRGLREEKARMETFLTPRGSVGG